MTKLDNSLPELTQVIVDALQDKKAGDITLIDLRKLPIAVADFFVIATGNSKPQIDALNDNVQRMVKTKLHETPIGEEGKENLEWILLDYADVVVHIFQPATREFYGLEELWSDAQITEIETVYGE
jgi:ribosome-associated protein